MKCLQASLLFAAFALQCMLEVRAIGDNEVILGNDVSDKVEARHIARVFFENDREDHLKELVEPFWEKVAYPQWSRNKIVKGKDWNDFLLENGASSNPVATNIAPAADAREAATGIRRVARTIGEFVSSFVP
ncbi:uncharacterized protein SPSC_06636 [Sporisorium scitamineum]|uniref:RxLR effector protein n=1 Tax=Sporisorium scitamineum TaxID=49012 RepID=A0A140KNR7_9BASI|nr:uncharacterized protein SPSC_06636 [Sporisorium scitamineum]